MKFMKLGSKPDAFQADGKFIRYVSSELATDVTINVGEVKFFLHKFPLLSKSNHMHKLLKANEENYEEIIIADFPGGPTAFEICAKFCYGMTVTLNAHNVVAARCAAEFLEMTEDVERGNLIYKIEVFLNSSIFRSWKDSIIVLQTTKSLLPWSEDLKIVGRCIDSIASKTSVDPANITWSYTYNKRLSVSDGIVEDTMKYREKMESVPKDWWIDDICELEIDLYKRVLFAIKSRGRMDGTVIGEALKAYARRWLPDSFEDLDSDDRICWYKYLVETILCLLPSDKGEGCSCSFLLKLLKVAIMIGLDDSYSENLVKSISVKLHEASVKDLLIPVRASVMTLYDVELVQCIVKHYLMHKKYGHDLHAKMSEKEGADFVSGHSNGDGDVSLLSVGKLIDGYLTEIAHDANLTVDCFIELSQLIPRSGRPIHDGLYKAIDKYLKEHLSVTKAERKRLCALMDVKKLSMDASMHAAQNERLPLRVVVQVLFFEQVRAAAGVQSVSNNPQNSSNSRSSTIEVCARTPASECKSLGKQMSQMKIKDEELKKNGILPKRNSKTSKSGTQFLPPRSRRIFDKLWVVGRQHGENRSSETSGSSQSPASMVPGDTKSSGSSSRTRQRRHSIS